MFILEIQNGPFVFRCGQRCIRVGFIADAIVRITYTAGKPFLECASHIVTAGFEEVACETSEDAESYTVASRALQIIVNKATGALTYLDGSGRLLVKEPERGGKWLTPKRVTRNIFAQDVTVALGESIDGARAAATKYETVFERDAFEAKLEFVFSNDEALFGLGSHEEGYGDLRGRSRELYQQNMKAVVPHLVSSRGYSVLLDCCSLMTFHDDALGAYWWADVVNELDYYVICGDGFDGVMQGYRKLTGATPLPPKWAFGYVQSKERYVTASELIEVVTEYRQRQIPLDCIVLDWKSWPNGAGWGQKSFDTGRFPDPDGLVNKLHAMGARLMVSIWPIMTGGCENQMELLEHGWMLGNKSTYNAFLPAARACYWEQTRRGLFAHGVDAWWCDCTEPFESDWSGAVKPEPHVRLAINTGESKLYLDAGDINGFSLAHSQGIYEGQRKANEAKRVLNLTRSSYAGQHRYGTFTWNGDICATWETLRRCIPEGVNFSTTGEAYWTVDAGGFFIGNDPKLWFWRGDYSEGCRGITAMGALEPDANDTGCTDLGFWELYTRWIQYAAFLPMFRSHGTDAAREIWRFGEEGTPFYDAIALSIRLRYRLLPYIYSLAAAVSFEGLPMMRALALEFPEDRRAQDMPDQYLFGPSLLVCPVTTPMYYDRGSRELREVEKQRTVYLPEGASWFNFWTEALHEGGQTIQAEAPLERMPLFVRAGSIVPMGEVMQFVDEVADAPYELRVYTGQDAWFALYEDAGDGYGYERGECAWVKMRWKDATGELTIGTRQGVFPAMVVVRELRVVLVSADGRLERVVQYDGAEIRLRMQRES